MNNITFRYSTLNTAEFCPEKFRLMVLEGKEEPGKKSAHFVIGTALHTAIHSHFDGGNMLDTFNMFWGSINPQEYDWSTSRQKYDEVGEMGSEWCRKWLKAHAHKYEPLHVEKAISWTLGKYSMSGTPDFVGYYSGKLSIVDWKTSAQDFDKRKGWTDLQMWLYAYAVELVYGLKVEQIVYAPFVKYGAKIQTPICFPVTKEKMSLMLEAAIVKMNVIETYMSQNMWPKHTNNCLRCPFITTCYRGDVK